MATEKKYNYIYCLEYRAEFIIIWCILAIYYRGVLYRENVRKLSLACLVQGFSGSTPVMSSSVEVLSNVYTYTYIC